MSDYTIYENCLNAVKEHPLFIHYVSEYNKTYELCLFACKNNGCCLKYVPTEHKDYNMCLAAASATQGMCLEFVPDQFWSNNSNESLKKLCDVAIRKCAHELEYIPNYYRTEDVIKTALNNNPYALKHTTKTKELCQYAVSIGGGCLRHVPDEYKDYELCLNAVKNEGTALKDVPEHLKTDELCREAIKRSTAAEDFLPDRLKKSKK